MGQETIKKMETYIKRNKNPKMLSTKRHVDKLIKAAYKNENDIKDKVAGIVDTYTVDKERVGK